MGVECGRFQYCITAGAVLTAVNKSDSAAKSKKGSTAEVDSVESGLLVVVLVVWTTRTTLLFVLLESALIMERLGEQ